MALGAPERFLLVRLDGTRTHADLVADLAPAIASGEIVIPNMPNTPETIVQAVESILKFFASCSLLEA